MHPAFLDLECMRSNRSRLLPAGVEGPLERSATGMPYGYRVNQVVVLYPPDSSNQHNFATIDQARASYPGVVILG